MIAFFISLVSTIKCFEGGGGLPYLQQAGRVTQPGSPDKPHGAAHAVCSHVQHCLAQAAGTNNPPFATPSDSDMSIIQRHLAKTLGNSFAESGSAHKLTNSQTVLWLSL